MPEPSSHFDPDKLLARARAGSDGALADLLERYRPYLALLARLNVEKQFQARIDDSDLVQETYLSAHRDFAQFRGASEKEFTAWLREIMSHVAANYRRDHRRRRRDIRLERQMHQTLDHSSQLLEGALVDPNSSPSKVVARRERAVLLAVALAQLPANYREVLVLREFEGKSLAKIALQMGRSENAVQKLWARALVQLRRHLRTALELT